MTTSSPSLRFPAIWHALVLATSLARPCLADPPTSYVNPMIGTTNGGAVYPGAVTPFGMVQFSPDEGESGGGYDYNDKKIQGFSMTHMSGTGCNGYGDVFVQPTTGPIAVNQSDYESTFTHANESAIPGYYQVVLDRWKVSVELTTAEHSGIARFSFPSGVPANLLIPISHSLTQSHAAEIHVVDDATIEGRVASGGFCGSSEVHTVYFTMHLSEPFQAFGTFTNGSATAGSREALQNDDKTSIGAYITYPSDAPRVIEAKIGISFVDLAGARRNLAHDIGEADFDAVKAAATAAWDRELRRIDVTAAPMQRGDLVKFYTALYHCLLMPNVWSDVDGRYIGFDNKVHTIAPGHDVYANYSGWDIYRNETILLGLIEPGRLSDMCQSISLMAEQLGTIDRWPTGNHPTGVMNGDPLSSVVTTAWMMGLRGFDVMPAYRVMTKKQEATDQIDRYGYIPGDVSATQEYCYAFSAVGRLAHALGLNADAARFENRAMQYRNLFHGTTGFMQPRDKDGMWPRFDPTQSNGYTEGSGWQYLWYEPQDVRGIVSLLGGDAAFNKKLDSFFAHPPKNWDPRYYNPQNEPDLQAPFMYYWSGAPWKSQGQVAELQEKAYNTSPSGIPGNDDCGVMSAWYVLTSLGFYSTDPSRPALEILTPKFRKAVVHLTAPYIGRAITIDGGGDGAYLAGVHVDGRAWTKDWISTSVLTSGATLVAIRSTVPDKSWGAAEADRPPSLSDSRPLLAPCRIAPEMGLVGDKVAITSPDPVAKVTYTLDGSDPTAASTRYVSPLSMNACCTLTARAFAPGRTPSPASVSHFGLPLPVGEGTGLSATYFSHRDLTGDTVVRIDPTLDFGWQDDKPDPKIGPENFSARWTGKVMAPYTADYAISTTSDDGIRVWIGGKLIIDDWTDHPPTADTAHFSMTAGQLYPIKIEYYNHMAGDECRLRWATNCIVEGIIPKGYLYPDAVGQ